MSKPDRISLLCVPPMKSWENNPTTKQGKQIISPQTNCLLEHTTLHCTDYGCSNLLLAGTLKSMNSFSERVILYCTLSAQQCSEMPTNNPQMSNGGALSWQVQLPFHSKQEIKNVFHLKLVIPLLLLLFLQIPSRQISLDPCSNCKKGRFQPCW